MCEMESPSKATPPLSSPPSPPKTPLNSTCYNCKKKGHFARSCPSKNPNKSPPAQHPTIYCLVCGGRCVVRVSGTDKNPNRSFYKCPAGCNFFQWCDQVTQDDLKLYTQSRFPQCPCGAGRCQKLKQTTGPNAGRSYFICPIKPGFGSCTFIQWEDTQVNTGVGQLVQESKRSGSSQSTCYSHQEFDLRKSDDSNLEQSEMMEIEVPERENPQGFPSFVSIAIPSADDMQLMERHIYDQRSDVSSPIQHDSSRFIAPKNGIPTLKSIIGDEAESLNCMTKKKVARVISFMSETEVHCRQIEFWRQISAVKSLHDIVYQSLGLRVLGWLGRLAFPPPRCLKDHPPKPFFCGIFPNFDPISVPQHGNMLNLGGLTPLLDHPYAELDKLSSPTHGVDHQLLNGLLWKPSGLKRSFATVQSDILISSFSESLEGTANPIQSLDQAAVQLQKILERTILNFQNMFVSILSAIDPSDHNTMTMVANKYFSYLDHLQLPIDYEPFFRRVDEYIESVSRLAGIEQSILKERSLEELTAHYNSEKVRFDNISNDHDEAIVAFANSSRRQQSLEEEASRVRAMLLQIENQLSCCKAETSELKTHVATISKDMLELKKNVEKAEVTLKLREQMEAERCAAKAALEQISWSMKRVCGLQMKKRQKV